MSVAHGVAGGVERFGEHQVCRRHAEERPGELSRHIDQRLAPAVPAAPKHRERHQRIEVGAGNAAEGEYQGDQADAGGHGIDQQRKRNVAAGQPLGGDAGTDDHGQQQRGADGLGDRAPAERGHERGRHRRRARHRRADDCSSAHAVRPLARRPRQHVGGCHAMQRRAARRGVRLMAARSVQNGVAAPLARATVASTPRTHAGSSGWTR